MAETKYKIVYAQPYVFGKSLIQEQILMIQMPGGSTTSSKNIITLIPDIWEDLKKSIGTYVVKHVKGDVWFWDDEKLVVTDTESEKSIKFKLQIPIPPKNVFSDFLENPNDSDWAVYWKKRLR